MRFRFHVLDLSLEVIRSLGVPMPKIRKVDRELHAQIRKSASSIALNLAEGNHRRGKDRQYHFNVAAGSANETRLALLVCEAWGEVSQDEIKDALKLIDQILAITWALTH